MFSTLSQFASLRPNEDYKDISRRLTRTTFTSIININTYLMTIEIKYKSHNLDHIQVAQNERRGFDSL